MKKFIKPIVFGLFWSPCLFVISTGCKKKVRMFGRQALCGSHTFEACCTETDCYYWLTAATSSTATGRFAPPRPTPWSGRIAGAGSNYSRNSSSARLKEFSPPSNSFKTRANNRPATIRLIPIEVPRFDGRPGRPGRLF